MCPLIQFETSKNMIILEDMSVFVSVVDNNSFSLAGRRLRMSASLVSSRISRLESHLGTRLLNRTTRKIEVTPSGNRFYEDSVFILQAVSRAEARASEESDAPKGPLKISVPVSFSRHIFQPTIQSFLNRYPDINLQLEITDRFSDLVEDRIDIALRMGQMEDSNFKARILTPLKKTIVASPTYLDTHGTPETPYDLASHNCLLLRFPGSKQFRWHLKTDRDPTAQVISGNVDATNTLALKHMARDGLGLSMQYLWDVQKDIAEGRLVQVLENYIPDEDYLQAIYPYEKYIPARIRVFIDFIAEVIKRDTRFK